MGGYFYSEPLIFHRIDVEVRAEEGGRDLSHLNFTRGPVGNVIY